MIGISGDLKGDAVFGLLVGIGFIMVNVVTPAITIGLPQAAALSAVDQYLVTGLIAPIFEEILFRSVLFGVAMYATKNLWIAIAGQAVMFSMYHWVAYGPAMMASFVGAFIFGIAAAVVAYDRKSILPAIVMHAIFNGFLLAQMMVVVG